MKYIIETRGLTKRYGEQRSVEDLSLHVRPGRIYGLLGRNGAGKTTTMRMLLGLTRPSAGSIRIFGQSMPDKARSVLPRTGSLIESPGFYPNLTGSENLRIFAILRRLPRPEQAIHAALDMVSLPYRDKKLFSQYSLGMKQRLAIALAIMHDPELLILDEPINGLDPIGIAEVRQFIRSLCEERGKTILISSHILSEIALLADDIGIIDHGVLLEEESLQQLEQKERTVSAFYRFGRPRRRPAALHPAGRAGSPAGERAGTDGPRRPAGRGPRGGSLRAGRADGPRRPPVRGHAGRLFQAR